MKSLIAISSCVVDIQMGYNQAIRDTWAAMLKDTDIDYRFFIGNGKFGAEDPARVNDLAGIDASWNRDKNAGVESMVPGYYRDAKNVIPSTLAINDDEIVLDVPDDYKYLPLKTKESHRWALDHGYDFVFQCFTDTYVRPHMMACAGYEKHDYVGWALNGFRGTVPDYASGGPGYWLSKRACELLITAPCTHWAEDAWVGQVMWDSGVELFDDHRYFFPSSGEIPYDCISKHLISRGDRRTLSCDALMREVHKRSLELYVEYDGLCEDLLI